MKSIIKECLRAAGDDKWLTIAYETDESAVSIELDSADYAITTQRFEAFAKNINDMLSIINKNK